MFGGIFHHLHGPGWARHAAREHLSPEERAAADESFEDRTADEFAAEHLGGVDPERLLETDEPPRG